MIKIRSQLSRIRIGEGLVLVFVILICLLVVIFSIKDYGASYDEILIHQFADNNVKAYTNLILYKPVDPLTSFYNLQYYGPFFWIVAKIASWPLLAIFPGLDPYDAWHIIDFGIFLLGAWFLFCLGRRLVSPRAALVAALLYLTQPLLWGHGIMNPKDIPFMVFFLATVLVGVRMVEEIAKPCPADSPPIKLFEKRRKYWISLVILATGLAVADLVTNHFLSRSLISSLILHAYSAAPGNMLHSLFLHLAAHAKTISAITYIDKAVQFVNVTEFGLVLLIVFGSTIAYLIRASSRNRWIFLAGITAGLTISVRILGPAAMGMVALYALVRTKRQAIKPLLAYLVIAIIAAYASWPFLWSDPFGRFSESLRVMANFPWGGTVRFEGHDYLANTLPWYYLPKLIGIQLTLPLLVLAAGGLAIIIYSIIRRFLDWKFAIIPVLWFFLPLAAVMLLRPSIYDNFRQFLFILPPIFLFAAVAIESLMQKLKPTLLKSALCLAILIPGIVAGVWLHPYEYVYYNALVGWTGNVGRSYETDYWYTSMCEMGRYLNVVAPDSARIALTDNLATTLFLRCTDKSYQMFVERVEITKVNPDFAIISTRYDDDLDYFRKMQTFYVTGRGKTIFSVAKKKLP